MDRQSDQALRAHLERLLQGRSAHMDLREVVAAFPEAAINHAPPNQSATAWHLLEHIRIAQHDILQFVRHPDYRSPPWPEGFWPEPGARTDAAGWEATLQAIERDLDAFLALVRDAATDLLAPLPHAPDYTVLREVLLVADHNAYHLGELTALRATLDIRPDSGWW